VHREISVCPAHHRVDGEQLIRFNSDLAKKPPGCPEYIIVREMAHLLGPTHNDRIWSLTDRFLPKWQFYRDQLNRLPVSHEEWVY